jgi:membrane fusion protein, heavy metal efflux system
VKQHHYIGSVIAIAGLMIISKAFAHGGEDHSTPGTSTTATASDATSTGMISMAKESQFALGILTERVGERQMAQTRSVTGRIIPAANGRAEVYAPQEGRVISSQVWKVGDYVSKGQTLFSIEQTLTGTERLDLERDLIETERELEEATRDYNRKRSLEGVVAQKEIEFARIRMEGASERRAALRQVLSRGTKPVSVAAPISGRISTADVVGGEFVEANRLLIEIVNTSTVWVEAQLFETDLAAMPKGTGAIITSPSAIGTYSGSLITVGNVISPETRTAPVIFAVANRNEQLKINASAEIKISTGIDAPALAVPKSAIVQSGTKSYVIVHRGPEEFEPVQVASGLGADLTHIQLSTGVKLGDKVVTSGLTHFKADLPQ